MDHREPLENEPNQLNKAQLDQINTFAELLNLKYGEKGTERRNAFDAKAEAFILAERLKELRKSTKLSQQALAERVGLKKSFISRVENGKVDIQLSTFLKILNGLGKRIHFT